MYLEVFFYQIQPTPPLRKVEEVVLMVLLLEDTACAIDRHIDGIITVRYSGSRPRLLYLMMFLQSDIA